MRSTINAKGTEIAVISNFKGIEFDSFLHEAGANAFTLSPQKWIESTKPLTLRTPRGKNDKDAAQ